MATSYDKIYRLNGAIMTDSKIQSLSDNLYYFTLAQYLDYAIAEFRKYCYQDLDDRTEFSQEIYEFDGDGATTDFVLSPAPPTDSLFYVSVDDVETEDYSYNSTTYTMTIGSTPVDGSDIYIGGYVIGSFDADLNVDEKRILAEGMTCPFIEYHINITKQLNQMIYGSIKLYSQANHNKVNIQARDQAYQRLHQMISNYTYSNDDDDLSRLVGET